MKKNFFKKLSFVMALAMMVTMIAPAAGALAASGPALNSTKKYLHLSGITGASEYDFNISGKKDGWKFSWTSANEDVAVVDAKNGQTVAKGVGTTKVTVAITDAEGNDVKELSADVVVRDNIETVAITNAPTAALAINQEWDFNRSFVTESGSTAATSSVTRWTVDKDTTATITAGGLFKATAAGDYKVTAMSFQSKAKYDAWKVSKDEKLVLATADVTVKVASEIKTVSQVNGTTVKVEFTSPMESVTAADLTVSYLVSSTPLLQTVKSITASDDKKTFTVVLYNAFATGASYRVAYKDMKAVDFTTATANVADVASVVITPATVVKDDPTDVVVKLFDKNGVDITNASLLLRVTLTNSSDKVWFNTGATHNATVAAHNELSMYNLGDTTTITGVFHTYDYDTTTGTEKGTVTGAATVTCVAATSYSVGTITAWSIATSAPSDSFASVNHILAVGDSGRLYVRSLKTDGTTYLTNTDANTGIEDTDNWRLTSSDLSVLYINGNSLLPLKAGSSTVVVEYRSASTSAYSVVGVVTVTVTAARVATNLKLDATSFTLSNGATVLDSKTVTIDVEDQYGIDMDESGVSVSKVATEATATSDLVNGGASSVVGTASTVTFNGNGAVAGTYNYKITANGLSRNVIITILAPKNADNTTTNVESKNYKLSLSASSFDVVLASDNTSEVATLKVVGYAANGVANEIIAASGNAVGYTVQIVDPDGTNVANKYLVSGASSTAITLAQTSAVSGQAIQAKTGTWTVKLLNANGVVADVVTFVVKNSQAQPVVTTAKLTTTQGNLSAAINDLFTATLNGTTITPLFVNASDIFGTGTSVFVKNVRYYDTLGIEYVVYVGRQVGLGFSY